MDRSVYKVFNGKGHSCTAHISPVPGRRRCVAVRCGSGHYDMVSIAYTTALSCLTFTLLQLCSVKAVRAQGTECAHWDRNTQVITFEGVVIGVADLNDNRAENGAGQPLSETLGLSCVTDGSKLYDPDDLRNPTDSSDSDDELDPCSVPGNPLCPGNNGTQGGSEGDTGTGSGTGSGGGGNGGSTGLGGSGAANGAPGVNGGNDPGDSAGEGGSGGGGEGGPVGNANGGATTTTGISMGPVGQRASLGEGGRITLATVVSTEKDIEDGGGGSSSSRSRSSNGSRNTARTGDEGRLSRPLSLTNALSQLMEGVRSSPTIIDPRQIKNSYPNLVHERTGDNRPALGRRFNYSDSTQLPDAQELGVDDEFLKTSLAIYQPLRRLHKDFLEDRTARDDYLDSAATLRGVTIMAMGFLDKTLGAGLVAIQQQADQDSAQHLLKQLNWTLGRIANDDRAHAYRDTDEKLEACLEYAMGREAAKEEIQVGETTRGRVHFECSQECGRPPGVDNAEDRKPYRNKAGGKVLESGNGTFAYCVCCAETADTLNALSDDGSRQPEDLQGEDQNQLFTLAERLFLGVSPGDNVRGPVEYALRQFKRIYGDVVLTAKRGKLEETNFHYYYQMPRWSPEMLVSLFKNRCHHTNGPPTADLGQSGTCNSDEDTEDFGVELGICPSIMRILENWEGILSGQVTLEPQWWTEASLGHALNGRQIKEFLALNGDPASSVQSGTENLLLARFLESFCEASAVAATARLHAHFKAHVLDHLALSQALSPGEKSQLMTLVDRYTHFLALTETDTSSKYLTEAALTGASIQYDRWKTAHMGSASQGAVAMANRSSNLSGVWGLLSAGHIVTSGGGGGTGATNENTREEQDPSTVAQTFTEAFGPDAGKIIAPLEQRRDEVDPIQRIIRRLPKRFGS